MTKGLTDPRHYAAIAEVLRGNSAETEGQFKPGEMAQKLQSMADLRYGEGHNAGYDAGMDAGYAEGYGIAQSLLHRSVTSFHDESIEELGTSAFAGCAKLESVTLPSVTVIGPNAFSGCHSLESVSLPLLETMGPYAFQDSCTGSIRLPKVKTVQSYAFQYGGVQSVILDAATVLGGYAFRGCIFLTDIQAYNVGQLGSQALADCRQLTQVLFPSCYSVTIGAFSGCICLQRIDLGQNAASTKYEIKANAFYGCAALTALVLRKTEVYTLASANAFTGTPIAGGTGYIYVPQKKLEAYKNATNWSAFADQLRVLEDYTINGSIYGALDESKVTQ